MKISSLVFLTGLLYILGCKNEVSKSKNEPLNGFDSISSQTQQVQEYNDGPPFKDTCLCDFKEFGTYKISNNNYNSYYNGKGVDFKLTSCSWIWGELVNNDVPDDTNVYIVKVHLLDLDNFKIPNNKTVYGNDTIKNYVVAIYQINTKTGEEEFHYDPFKTGKYKH